VIIKQLQDYIEEEKDRVWKLYKKESDQVKKKALGKEEEELRMHYNKVDKPGYSDQ
jgi:ribosome recycling factor